VDSISAKLLLASENAAVEFSGLLEEAIETASLVRATEDSIAERCVSPTKAAAATPHSATISSKAPAARTKRRFGGLDRR